MLASLSSPVEYCNMALSLGVSPQCIDSDMLSEAFSFAHQTAALAAHHAIGRDDDAIDNDDAFTVQDWQAYIAGRPFRRPPPRGGGFSSDKNAPLRRQPVCRNCFAFGHEKSSCRSPARDLGEMIDILQKVRLSVQSGPPSSAGATPASASQPRPRPPSPNGGRPRPFGSRAGSHARVRIAQATEDDEDATGFDALVLGEMFMMDVAGSTRPKSKRISERSRKDKCTATPESQHGGDKTAVDAASPPAEPRSKPRYVKLVIYGITDRFECELYIHRMNTRDDSTDLFGVKCHQDEPLHEAAMRCVVSQLEPIRDLNWLHPIQEGINGMQAGHHTFDMRVDGSVAAVTLFCIHIEDHHYTQRPISAAMWEQICPDSNVWQSIHRVYEIFMPWKRAFATGLKEALLSVNMHPDLVPRSPSGTYSEPDEPEGGRFTALALEDGELLQLYHGGQMQSLPVVPLISDAQPAVFVYAESDDDVEDESEYLSDGVDLATILDIAGRREPVVLEYEHDAMGILFTYINMDLGHGGGVAEYARDPLSVHMALRLTCKMLKDAVDHHGRAPMIAHIGHWIAGRRLQRKRLDQSCVVAKKWQALAFSLQVVEAVLSWHADGKCILGRFDQRAYDDHHLSPKQRLDRFLFRKQYFRLKAHVRPLWVRRIQGLHPLQQPSSRKRHMAQADWDARRSRANSEACNTAWYQRQRCDEIFGERRSRPYGMEDGTDSTCNADVSSSDGSEHDLPLRSADGSWLYRKKRNPFRKQRPSATQQRGYEAVAFPTEYTISTGADVGLLGEAYNLRTRPSSNIAGDKWHEMIVDSGATRHCTPFLSDLSEYAAVDNPDAGVTVGNGAKLPVTHIGHALLRVPIGDNKFQTMKLTHILVVPDMTVRLFSTGWGWAYDGIESHFNGETCLTLPGKEVVMFTDHPRHYSIVFAVANTPAHNGSAAHAYLVGHDAEAYAADADDVDDGSVIHRRLAHFSVRRIMASRERSAGVNLDAVRNHDPSTCRGCLLNKRRPSFTRSPVSHTKHQDAFGQLISSDLMQMPESVPHGYRYVMVFLDAASSYLDVRFLLDKSPEGVIDALRSFTIAHRDLFDAARGPTVWKTDNGGEFTSTDVDEFCAELSTRHVTVPSRSPQDNGGAERANGILLRQTRIVLAAANLVDGLWPFACKYIAMVHNSLSTRAIEDERSPYEFVKHRIPRLEIFHVFGCKCIVALSKADQDRFTKTSPTAVEAINLGYNSEANGYHVYIPEFDRYTVAHASTFLDDQYLANSKLHRSELHPQKPKQLRKPRHQAATQLRPDEPEPPVEGDYIIHFSCGVTGEVYKIDLKELGGDDIPIPKSYDEAVHPSNPYAPFWIAAINEEITGKQQNGEHCTWTPTPRETMIREGRRPMKTKWVFTIKRNIDGSIEKFKARLVGCGYSQIEGVDYKETFASTIRGTTIRCFFAEAAALDLELELVDVTKAFTQATVPERLFIELPQGAEVDGMVGLLNQNLEGTKQGAHLWQKKLCDALAKRKFVRSEIDPNLYVLRTGELIMFIIVWVDDMAIAHNNPEQFNKFFLDFKAEINSTTKKLDRFVGIEVTRDWDRHTITLKQANYVEAVMKRHLSIDASKAWKHVTPCGTSRSDVEKFTSLADAKSDGEKTIVANKGYLAILGALLYAMCMTMPDIAFHCARLAVHMQSPSTEAYEALLNVLEYCYHRRNIGLTFGGEPTAAYTKFDEPIGAAPEIHADASFGGREVSPFAGGFIRWRNAAVAWLSRKLKFIPQSSCEAEVAAMVAMCKEAMFVASVLESMGVTIQKPMPAITDSKSAYDIVRNPGVTKHTTHFTRWLHLARRLQLMRHINVYLETTELMMADDKTKALGEKSKVIKCRAFQLNSKE